jgi:polar amino acid transport system substrate-binding protein
VVLEVKDEGEGIAAEHLPHLTDPFFTTKRDTGGTGLGLSVSAGIVKDHGGSLLFDSPPGAGMTAILRLPAFTEEQST